jgi:hypothetical protein
MPETTFPIAAAADDGSGWKEHTVWASIASGTFEDGSSAFDDTILGLQKQLVGATYRVNLTFLRFDTSSIPDDHTIVRADLQLFCTEKLVSETTLFAADYYDFGGEPPVDADWELTSSGNCIRSFSFADLVSAGVTNIRLSNLDGISRTGTTGIRIAPATSTAPTLQNYVLLASQEHASQEPRLVVTHQAQVPNNLSRFPKPSLRRV